MWDESCEHAFTELKRLLSSEPVLAFPRLGEPFVVDVDASDVAFGGVLMQRGEDNLYHPVAYFSDSVKPSQVGWAATTKEAFALVLAVRHWYVYLAGTEFVLNSDHNPLVYLRSQKDPRGKFSRWILELEEFNYTVKYIPGAKNVKADALSRNKGASVNQPPSRFEDKIYSVFEDRDRFKEQLEYEQDADPVIRRAKECVLNGEKISKGRLKRVQAQLRMEKNILTKSGRPVVPAPLRSYVPSQLHNTGHWGTDKTYALLQERFFWPSMYTYTQNFVSSCATCQQVKCDTRPPKAPIIPMVIPDCPMQFISIDIAYMPHDTDGYKYILLVGDIFSKFIQAIPLRDQSAPSIIRAFKINWLYIHGCPLYILSDQGSNVDGDTMREFAGVFGIEKRRSSPYHSAGNGFAERNIRSVREVLRATLLDKNISQSKWRNLLPGLVFALNCSLSKATKCIPYDVVFGRCATLPLDILLDTHHVPKNKDSVTPKWYIEEIGVSLKEMWALVTKHLQISKYKMLSQYNKNLRFHDYQPGQKVWLKTQYVKSGENKLLPKRSGPWTVISKLPNGVNFRITNDKTRVTKIVHHDRLKAVRNTTIDLEVPKSDAAENLYEGESTDYSSSSAASENHSDYSPSESETDDPDTEPDADRRYPIRERRQREIPGALPWDAVQL